MADLGDISTVITEPTLESSFALAAALWPDVPTAIPRVSSDGSGEETRDTFYGSVS